MFISSIATYGSAYRRPVNEDTIQMPISMYGITKVFGERMGEYYHSKIGGRFQRELDFLLLLDLEEDLVGYLPIVL